MVWLSIVCPPASALVPAHDCRPGDGEERELKKIVEPTSRISVHRSSVHTTLSKAYCCWASGWA